MQRKKYSEEIVTITINYFGRIVQERRAALGLVKAAQVQPKIVNKLIKPVLVICDINTPAYSYRFVWLKWALDCKLEDALK